MRLSLKSVLLAAAGIAIGACADAARSSDRQRVHPSAHVLVAVPPPEPSITVDDLLDLHFALVHDDFGRLDERLRWNLDSARRDTGYELRYRAAFGVFLTGDSSIRPHLDAWVAHQPQSSVAHLARAAHFISMGDNARGGKWARETSAEQFRGMRSWFGLARADLATANALDSTNVAAYWMAMNMAMNGSARRTEPVAVALARAVGTAVMSWAGQPVVDRTPMPYRSTREILDAGLQQVPGSFILRWRYAYSLRPRWGGSFEEIEAFADECDSAAALNPRLPLLRGFIAYDSAVVLARDDRDDEAIAMFTKAMSYGDHWMYRTDRAAEYRATGRYQEALADYDSALAEHPALVEARAERGGTLYRMARNAMGADAVELARRAKLDICIAAEIDPTSSHVLWEVKHAPELRPLSMGGPPPLSPIGEPEHPLLAGRC